MMVRYLIALALIFISAPAYAQEIERTDVEKHLSEFAFIYNKDKISPAEIYEFIEGFVAQDGKYKNIIHIDGYSEPLVISVNTEELLKSLKEKKETYLASDARYEIQNFAYDDVNKTAQATYKFWQNSTVEAEDPQQGHKVVSYESISTCDETYKMEGSKLVVPQSTCEVQLKYVTPQK